MSFTSRSMGNSRANSRRTSSIEPRRRTLNGNSNNNISQSNVARNRKSPSNKGIQLSRTDSDLGSNIQVHVRCRSRNQREIDEKSSVVISTMGPEGKEVILANPASPLSYPKKTYMFDQVFGAESDQELVFNATALNYIKEMLQGYNCTIFAYGQTGTGKTYTMSGDINILGDVESQDKLLLGEHAGIIPRVLVDLFQQLAAEKNEYTVKISFLELYNERLKDLLAQDCDEEETIRIFDNHSGNSQKSSTNSNGGNSAVNNYSKPNSKSNNSYSSIMVKGMEEIYIKSAYEGLQLLTEGSLKRKVASTKCNDLSSRSHTIFTITTNITRIDPVSGEQYVKIGKLNLVDLAGSENINRSGAENKRAQEAGLINKSLLTLGRVINALVDHSQHIPYRESKLTRLLQDSLGGKTKTCIIATISPAKISMEETVSTLEYATRAKSIKNTPQVNQSMSKDICINAYVEEIERIKQELKASRQKEGVYITQDQYDLYESNGILIEEQKLKIQNMEEQIQKFKDKYVKQTEMNKTLEVKIAEFEQEKTTLLEEKALILKTVQEYFTYTDDFIRKVKDVHGSNIQLTDKLKEERDRFKKECSKIIESRTKTLASVSEENNNIENLQSSLKAYHLRFESVILGVFEELSEKVTKQTNNTRIEVSSINLNKALEILKQLEKSVSVSLNGLQQPRSDKFDNITSIHTELLQKCEREVNEYCQKLEFQLGEAKHNLLGNISKSKSDIEIIIKGGYNTTSRVVENGIQNISELEQQLKGKQEHVLKSDNSVELMKKYIKEEISQERNDLFDQVRSTMDLLNKRFLELDDKIYQKSQSLFDKYTKKVSTSSEENISAISSTAYKSINNIESCNDQVQKNILKEVHRQNNSLADITETIPIREPVMKLLEVLRQNCDETSSSIIKDALSKLDDDISENVKVVSQAIESCVSENILKLQKNSDEDLVRLRNILSSCEDLHDYITKSYKDNITQISKTQADVLEEHCIGLEDTIRSLRKTAAQDVTSDIPDNIVNVDESIQRTLPHVVKPNIPGLLITNADFSTIPFVPTNISPVRLIDLTKFNPTTPVPVPDHPLTKVLVPRSVNSTAKRANTLTTSIKKISVGPLNNNLKRKFAVDEEDVVSQGEDKENIKRSHTTE